VQLSHYTIIVKNYPEKEKHLLFNTRTQGMVKINEELRKLVENYYAPRNFSLKVKYCNELEQLYKMGILVNNEEDDRKKLGSFFHQLKHDVRKSCLQATILTTYACNFQCVYCFEEGSRKDVSMDISTADQAMQWLKKNIERLGYESLSITFYGGEPLLNKPVLEHIATHLKNWCEKKNIGFKFTLQTNGYLMTPECIDKYLKLGLCRARVSVDGPADVHDLNRPLRGGGKTFDRIMENILASIDKVTICISTSYQQDDIGHIEKLLDYFDKLGILNKLDDFVFSPIQPSLGPNSQPKQIRMVECMGNYEDEVLVSANTKIQELMRKRKLPFKGGMTVTACPLTMENGSVVIDQEGRIYKCNSMLGYPEFAVGDVRQDEFNDRNKEFVNIDAWKKCPEDCVYLPMCSGGCRFMSYLYNKNFTTPVCKKNYLDKMTPAFIKREYEALTGTAQ